MPARLNTEFINKHSIRIVEACEELFSCRKGTRFDIQTVAHPPVITLAARCV